MIIYWLMCCACLCVFVVLYCLYCVFFIVYVCTYVCLRVGCVSVALFLCMWYVHSGAEEWHLSSTGVETINQSINQSINPT